MSDFFSGEETKIEKIIKKDKSNKGSAVKWFYSHYISIFSTLLVIIAGFAFFVASFDFPIEWNIREISINFAIVFACGYMLFVNGSITGSEELRKTNDYLNAISKYNSKLDTVNEKQISYLMTEFCEDYTAKELDSARQAVLSPNNVTLEQFKLYLNGNEIKLNQDQLQAVLEAKRIKPISLTKNMLIDKHGGGKGRNPIISKQEIKAKKIWGYVRKAISLIIFSLAVVDFIPEIIVDFSLQTIVTASIKIISMLSGFVMGIKFGFNIESLEQQRIEETNKMLEQFLEWVNKK